MTSSLIHTTAYQFLDCPEGEVLCRSLSETCEDLRLKGSVTLAPEGINLSLSGPDGAIAQVERFLSEESPFQDLRFRHSHVTTPPFSRLIVRFRPSLLPMHINTPVTQRRQGMRLPPKQLCQWLDESRPLHLLDVRNTYETQLGRFMSAKTLPLQRFRDIQTIVRDLAPSAVPVVTYCTGGIRCELASTLLHQQGYPEVWQLSGGILHYLEQCGNRHWEGECFVFDDRLAVNTNLRATYPRLCRTCQKPIAEMELNRCTNCGNP